jgi:hypothetical protein
VKTNKKLMQMSIDTCADPRSKMFPAKIPRIKFSTLFPSSSISSFRFTTPSKSDIALAFSSSYL